jgi:hypothetical protein
VSKQAAREDALSRKIRSLPPEKVAEVEDFVEFLAQRDDRQLTQATAKLAEKAFRKAWDSPVDAAYDRLQLRRRRTRALPLHRSERHVRRVHRRGVEEDRVDRALSREATIEKRLVLKKLGQLQPADVRSLRTSLDRNLG